MNKKIYVVGGSLGYANWMLPIGNTLVHRKEDADIFVFTGGADLDPAMYGEQQGRYTHSDKERSAREKQYFDYAVKNRIKMIGICLGSQSLGVWGIPNAKLIQHMRHPSPHNVYLPYHNKEILVSSCHHQMLFANPENEGKDYLLLAYTNKLSPFHLDGNNQDYNFDEDYKEIEGFYIPSICAMGLQCHPEFLDLDHPSIKVIQEIFEQYLG